MAIVYRGLGKSGFGMPVEFDIEGKKQKRGQSHFVDVLGVYHRPFIDYGMPPSPVVIDDDFQGSSQVQNTLGTSHKPVAERFAYCG